MWIALAVIAFIAGQVYLFRCLGSLDHFLEQRSVEEMPEREILSLVFEDPDTAECMSGLLEDFSGRDPDVDMILLTSRDVLNAVYDGRAAVGFLPAGVYRYHGLNRLRLTETCSQQEIVWKSGAISAPAEAFLQYLRDRGAVDSGIGR